MEGKAKSPSARNAQNQVTFNISEAEERARLEKKIQQEKLLLDEKDKVMNDTRESHKAKQENSTGRKSITVNNVEMKVQDFDLDKLLKE